MSCAVSSVLWTRGNIYEPKPNPVCFLVSPLDLEDECFSHPMFSGNYAIKSQCIP